MILYGTRKFQNWYALKMEWKWVYETKGHHQINRPPVSGFAEVPSFLKEKVEGDGFVMVPEWYVESEPNHTIGSGSSIYGNSYCGYLNSF